MPHHAIAMAMSVGAGLFLAGVSLKVARATGGVRRSQAVRPDGLGSRS
jgi:hypothetical protein